MSSSPSVFRSPPSMKALLPSRTARPYAASLHLLERSSHAEIPMIAVIFEVWPAQGKKDDYLRLAAALRDELQHADGFISIERFQSLTEPEKLLSLSFWRDE